MKCPTGGLGVTIVTRPNPPPLLRLTRYGARLGADRIHLHRLGYRPHPDPKHAGISMKTTKTKTSKMASLWSGSGAGLQKSVSPDLSGAPTKVLGLRRSTKQAQCPPRRCA